MSEESSGEKVFDPTPQKLAEARRKGDVAKSTDVHTAATYLALLAVFVTVGGFAVDQAASVLMVLIAQPDRLTGMILGPGGAMMPHTVQSAIICDFTHGMVRPDESVMAAEKWLGLGTRSDGTPIAFGAMPSVQSGVVNGVAHDSWQPMMTFSVFDTESIPNLEERECAEKRLLEDSGNGLHYIQVGHRPLSPPWPTYEEMRGIKGNSTAQMVCRMIEDGGMQKAGQYWFFASVLGGFFANPFPHGIGGGRGHRCTSW